MSTDLALFKKNPALKLLEGIEDNITGTLAGGGGGNRISIRGGRFREVINGEEVRVSKESELDVVIVAAATMSRHFYDGPYVEGESSAPTCWSRDTQVPADDVPEDQRQASRCMDCPQNIKGSGQGESRACRFSQRVAVVLDGAIEDGPVYQMQLPATSLFGGDKNKMSMQGYARLLKAHNTHIISVVTRMTMDVDSTTPMLTFSPVRPLDEDELRAVIEHKDSPEALNAITFTVAQADRTEKKAEKKEKADLFGGAKSKPAPAPEPAADDEEGDDEEAPAPTPAPAAVKTRGRPKGAKGFGSAEPATEPVAEPKRREQTKAPEPAAPVKDLGSMLDEWDDE
jgi:hypothetical protein